MQDPNAPPPQGEYLPPPPPPLYRVTSDIPPDSPYHYSPAPRQTGRQAAGWLGGAAAALFGFIKYGGLLLLKIPALGTLVSLLISFGAWAWIRGPWFAAALVTLGLLVSGCGGGSSVNKRRRPPISSTPAQQKTQASPTGLSATTRHSTGRPAPLRP